MSYLRFDKSLMVNLEESLPREILRANKSGAYHCTTIVDCNTRKYHGLLVIPIPELDDENHVLLSSLDETVVQHGAEFNLGLHKYNGDHFNPNGHKYIREFDCEKIPKTIYRVGGVLLSKEKIFVQHENRILIRYTLLDAHSKTLLRLKPFLAFRNVHEYTHENDSINKEYTEVQNGLRTSLYPGYPELYMQVSKQNHFEFIPAWNKNIEYQKELERGYHFDEDLYVPGYFEVEIKKGESVVFSAGLSETPTETLLETFNREVDFRTPRDSFEHCLINSAHQFHNKQGDMHYILAGYPWFKCRARDMLISLPGLTLAINERNEFEDCMKTIEVAIDSYMRKEDCDCYIFEMDNPDILLWAVWTIQQYAAFTSDKECFEKYGSLLEKIIDFVINNRQHNLFLHENGLLYTNGVEKAVTWMNSTANGKPVVPRTGYIVEINALWYNALKFASQIFSDTEKQPLAHFLDEQANRTGESFKQVFLNEYGYLFDYVNGTAQDWSVRPNMIFTVAFEYSPLDKPQRKAVLDIVTKELLTPKGLRSLSPKSEGYNPNYVGTQNERDYAYHQGTAWPWLMGFYFQAYYRIYKRSGISFIERNLIGFEEEMTSHCIGSIPELFDGNPPFKGRGAVSFAMNIAEILRTLRLLKIYKEEEASR